MYTESFKHSREIRVFLSSTFRDMDEERTYLVKQIFPKVRTACFARQVNFSEIDLRWGISEEESKNGATVEICLKEINRCRNFPPFFIGFLGERYGWIPKHEDLAAYWDRRNDTDYEMCIRKAVEHEKSVTELEMELAVLGDGAAEKIAGHALFCLRDSNLTDTLYDESKAKNPSTRDIDFYDDTQGKLIALKQKIEQSGFLGLNNYTSIEQFGSVVEAYLLAQLDHYFPSEAIPTNLERGNASHAGFRFQRLQNFLPRIDIRESMIKAIENRIEAPSLGPILVIGRSGQGKSALMSDLARHVQLTNQTTEGKKDTWRVFDHYIGADNASYLESWIYRILLMLHPEIQDISGNIPDSPKDKAEALSTWISMAARRNHCHYLFILDALDQLNDNGKNLEVLTSQLLGPDGVLIASAADNTLAQASASHWQTIIEVPALTDDLRKQLVTDTMARFRKHLPENLVTKLAYAPQSGSPLFLGLALEELRINARHETLEQLLNDTLEQPDAKQLFLNKFLLDTVYGRPDMSDMAARFMALLGAARAGLSEIELADLLALPNDPIASDTGKPRLPQIHLSRLINNFAPFLINKEGRRAPMHRIFGEVALHHFGAGIIRKNIYIYCEPSYGKGDNQYEARKATEALYQITQLAKLTFIDQKKSRAQLIGDLSFLGMLLNIGNDDTSNELLLLDSFTALSDFEQNQLNKLWTKEIDKLDLENVVIKGPMITRFGDWLSEYALYYLSTGMLESFFITQQRLLPPDHLEIASSSSSLGLAYSNLARFDESVTLLRKALRIWESKLGPDHPETANGLNNLGSVLSDVDGHDSEEAKELMTRAVNIREKSLERDDPLTATSLNNLGIILHYNGDYFDAEQAFKKALVIREKVLGTDHPHTATTLNNLAYLLRDQGEIATAESMFRRSLSICEKSLGPIHPDTGLSCGSLARILSDKGEHIEAIELFNRALIICKKSLGEDHPFTIITTSLLASEFFSTKNYKKSENLYRIACEICEKKLGRYHPSTLHNLNNLSVFFRNIGNLDIAEPIQLESISRHIQVYGEGGLKSAVAYCSLAALFKLKGDLAEAKNYYQKALLIRERELGADAESTKLVKTKLKELFNLI